MSRRERFFEVIQQSGIRDSSLAEFTHEEDAYAFAEMMKKKYPSLKFEVRPI